MSDVVPDLETEIPASADFVEECPYCERPFVQQRAYRLHLGEVHADECTAEEWDAYRDENEAEADELFFFHLRVVIALGVLYSMSVIGYTAIVQMM